jgi:sulfopropanediol 3-dehydrogenase
VLDLVDKILSGMPTADLAGPAWCDHGEVVVVEDLTAAWKLADGYASEHVEVLTKNPRDALSAMKNFGALFLGEGTCVSYGDKVIGTNHTLPTRGTAKYTGGLWVGNYLKAVTFQEITDISASARLGELCARAARVEQFEGHARAGDVRVHKYAGATIPWAPTSA